MNSFLTFATAAALMLTASSALAEPHPHPAGPVLTNGWPVPPQVFAPEAPARVAGRSADRVGPVTPR